MRTGFADLGTNTFNYLIVDISNDGHSEFIQQGKIPVMLGKSGLEDGSIKEDRMIMAIDAMKEIRKRFTSLKVQTEKTIATSAFRSATNGMELANLIKSESGFDIEVIDGDREAELIYKGVRYSGLLSDSPALIMDIGGGSTELIMATQQTILWKKSYPLGVARVMEKIKPSDPILASEVEKTMSLLDEALPDFLTACKIHKPTCLIGSSGSFDTFADLVNARFNRPFLDEHCKGTTFVLDEFYQICRELRCSNRSERINMKGMIEMRVDYIVLAALFTEYVLTKTGLTDLRLSCYALKEGALFEQIEKIKP